MRCGGLPGCGRWCNGARPLRSTSSRYCDSADDTPPYTPVCVWLSWWLSPCPAGKGSPSGSVAHASSSSVSVAAMAAGTSTALHTTAHHCTPLLAHDASCRRCGQQSDVTGRLTFQARLPPSPQRMRTAARSTAQDVRADCRCVWRACHLIITKSWRRFTARQSKSHLRTRFRLIPGTFLADALLSRGSCPDSVQHTVPYHGHLHQPVRCRPRAHLRW